MITKTAEQVSIENTEEMIRRMSEAPERRNTKIRLVPSLEFGLRDRIRSLEMLRDRLFASLSEIKAENEAAGAKMDGRLRFLLHWATKDKERHP